MRLLQIASPESLIRLTKTKLRGESKQLSKIFFTDQKHDSLISLLQWSLLQKHHFLQVSLLEIYRTTLCMYLLEITAAFITIAVIT